MKINSSVLGNSTLVIQLREESLDASNVQVFKDEIQALLKHHTRVVFDLEGVRFIDSSGIGALLSCMRQMRQRQGEVRLCRLSATVIALFELMRLDRVFTLCTTCEEATNFDTSGSASPP
ncbi:STAS domain-containing protein [Variovorax sp. LT2P21]|uniref:STAS domain-containing protein n=1 Tax=Variovorax sp. LT2P21 TaxID=3443731 RepID=UPI003F482FDA